MNGRRVRGANVPSPTPVARHRDAAIRPATSSPETHPMKVMTVFGTRPEAIKMFPVVHALRERCGVDVRVCVRSEERRVGKECVSTFRSRGSQYHKKKKSATAQLNTRPTSD